MILNYCSERKGIGTVWVV